MARSVKKDAINLSIYFPYTPKNHQNHALDGTHTKWQISIYHSFGQPGSDI